MDVLRGKEVSEKLKIQVQEMLEQLHRIPCLAIVRLGNQADDISYEKGAVKKMKEFGLRARTYVFEETVSDEEFKKEFQKINEDPDIDGILVLKPLPEQIVREDIEYMIDPMKDLDGISPVNIAKVFSGDTTGFAPCTAEAVLAVLRLNHISLAGKRAVVVGRSMVVGRPLAMLLLQENATVTVCHTKTEDLPQICRSAQILITAAGCRGLITGDYVGKGAIVIDVGMNVDENGHLCGDVDFETIQKNAAMATPVPGGIGAVTTAVLARRLVSAALALDSRMKKERNKIDNIKVKDTFRKEFYARLKKRKGADRMKKMKMYVLPFAAAGMLMLSGCGQASVPDTVKVQNTGEMGIQVTSREQVKVVPDMAEIVYSVYSQASEAQTCQTQNQTDLQTVMELLKGLGVEEKSIQTSNYGLNPIYDWENGKTITGYEMDTQVTVSNIPLEQVGTILSKSVDGGVNTIQMVTYQSSSYREAYQEALTKAIATAKEKAAVMAEAGNCKLGKIVGIEEYNFGQDGRINGYQQFSGGGMAVKEMADMEVMPGEIEIEASISVNFEIE